MIVIQYTQRGRKHDDFQPKLTSTVRFASAVAAYQQLTDIADCDTRWPGYHRHDCSAKNASTPVGQGCY